MAVFFISDLHLDAQRPESLLAFNRLVEKIESAQALYILGDFVEYWLGDDDNEHQLDSVFEQLAKLSTQGVSVFFMHGNRDFLIGAGYLKQFGIELLSDPHIIELNHQRILLMHGDLLCTDDTDYQNFRLMVRSQNWQTQFLQKPVEERRAIVSELRKTSLQAIQDKAEDIMDVNQTTVEKTMREHGVNLLIHGHTHRPGIHRFNINSEQYQRIVLGDWYKDSSVLSVTEKGFQLTDLNGLS